MTRTGAYKAMYISMRTIVGLVVVGAGFAIVSHRTMLAGALLVVLVLLSVPGRVQAFFWSDLLAGLHHLNRRDYARSKRYSEHFLERLRVRPRLKRLIWLGTSSYTRDAETMALNNLGAAELGLGDKDAARAHFLRAIESDPTCPLPYRNMAILTLRTGGSSADVKPWVDKAWALGLRNDWSGRIVKAARRRNAARSAAGPDGPIPPLALSTERFLTGAFVVELINDDTTPFDFVVFVLERVFGMTGQDAVNVAFAVDDKGRAVCAAFDTEAMAQEKANEIVSRARAEGFPLMCVVRAGR